jgi:ribose 5-phosphate isomerase RpiB
MIYTARQLEELHKTNGHVRLPVGARMTPMASDWLRSKKLSIVYADEPQSATKETALSSPAQTDQWLWWCDGPCGAAKAAVLAQAKETNLQPMTINAEPKYTAAAVKQLAKEIREGQAIGGVLLVQTGAAAVVFANRCPSLRAMLGTCRESVQQGIDSVGANVLIIETPHLNLSQMRNVLSLFVSKRREPGLEVKQQLQELASCG